MKILFQMDIHVCEINLIFEHKFFIFTDSKNENSQFPNKNMPWA